MKYKTKSIKYRKIFSKPTKIIIIKDTLKVNY